MPQSSSAPRGHPERIVSLVPSITESLFELGLGERVVGVTDWCVHPADSVAGLPKLGGTKDPDVGEIAALAPDLVIANHEENTRRVVEKLDDLGLSVWVTYPRTVREGAGLLSELAGLGASARARQEVVEPVLAAVAEAREARAARDRCPRVLCPIWRDPWMAPGPDTYAHDLIELCGGRNVHSPPPDKALGSRGPEPGRARTRGRYPRLTLDEIVALSPEVVLLPDEPYAFGAAEARELAGIAIPAATNGRIHLIDGTWVSWYGPRIGPAIRELRRLFS